MKYVDISEYIDTIRNTPISRHYFRTSLHTDYIRSLSLEDYGKWLEFMDRRQREYRKRYAQEHKEHIREIKRLFLQRHPGYMKEHYRQNRERRLESIRRSQEKNKEKYRERKRKYAKEYNIKNKERIKLYRKAYYDLNKVKEKIRTGDYYLSNRKRIQELCRINGLYRYWKRKLDVLKIRFLLGEKC